MILEYKNYTDEELIKLIIEDNNIFVEIVKRYQNKLLYYILRISNVDIETAEDMLQEIFLKIYKNIYDFNQSLKFSSWIYRITHNYVIDNYRKSKKQLEVINIEDKDIISLLVDPVILSSEFDKKLLGEKIYQILNKLDIKYKEVLILYFLEDMKYKEISDILKKPINSVSTLLNRAKIQFKELAIKNNLDSFIKNLD